MGTVILKSIISGIPFICLGIVAIVNKQWCLESYSPYCFDFHGYSTPFGILFIVFGVLFSCFEIRKRLREITQETQKDKSSTEDKPPYFRFPF
jgi:hypothetical protein